MNKGIGLVALGIALFPASIHAQSEKPLALSPSTLAPFDFLKSEQEYEATSPRIPREVTAADLAGVTDQTKAAQIVEAAKLVYRHYVWANRKPRYPAPAKFATQFAESKPGYCESATLVVRNLLSSDNIQSDSFNFLVPNELPPDPLVIGPNFEPSGHTVARMKLEHGAVIIDPTYGFALITSQPDFDNTTFADKTYKIFSLFDKPADPTGLLSPYAGLQFYGKAAIKPAFVGPSTDRIIATMPTISIPSGESVQIGVIDNSNNDIENAFGGFANHIGFWYQPTKQVWKFAPKSSGVLKVTFYLLSGDNAVLKIPLDVDIDTIGANVLSIDRRTSSDNITLTLDVSGPFTIEFTSQSTSARLVDAISIRRQERQD